MLIYLSYLFVEAISLYVLLILNFESLSKILLHFTSTKKYNYESQLFYKWGVVVFFSI